MAIYLDSNVMYGWRTFTEPPRLALAVLAGELAQAVVIPSLVVEELEGPLRRELEDTAAKFDEQVRALHRLFDVDRVNVEPTLRPDDVIGTWRAGLHEAFERIEVLADDALTGLRREITGQAPARRASGKPGVGGRDTAIRLAIVRDHRHRDEPGHLISADTRAFLDAGQLRVELQADLADCDHPLTVHASIEDFLSALGASDVVKADPSQIAGRVLPLLREGLATSISLPRAVFDESGATLEFRTDVTAGELLRVRRAQRFSGQFGEILLVDSEWRIEFDLLYRRPADDPDTWFVVNELDARGRVQAYLAPNSGQFIGAQMKPRQHVQDTESGLVIWSDDE